MAATGALATLSRTFQDNASRTLLVRADGAEVTYADFFAASENMARRLVELGVRNGERVMIQLDNSEELLSLYVACALAGVVAAPFDPQLPAPRAAALRARLAPKLLVDASVLPSLRADASAATVLPEHSPDDDFLVIFSSGSTGEPKGIVHTLSTIVASAQSFAGLCGLNSDSVIYHHFPMFYMAGIFNLFFSPVLAGGKIVLGPAFSKAQMLRFWELPVKHGVNHLTLTPTMALSLAQLFRVDGKVLEHLSHYQAIIATGGPLYRSVAERFLQVFNAPLRTCYGVTELGGTITFQSWEDALAFQSMGSAAAETEIRAGSENQPAEIVVKTPFMAKGYLVKGELVDFRDADGFFHTGDIGYLKDGLLYFSGREHDLVKKGGEFVSAQLIEDIGLRNSSVTDVAAVGVPDEFWGARLVLFYVPQQNANEPEVLAEFDKLFVDGLRAIERPDKIIPVPWMPKTSIGKVIKRELVDKYTVNGDALLSQRSAT